MEHSTSTSSKSKSSPKVYEFPFLASSVDSLRTSLLQHISFLVSRPTSDLVILLTHPSGLKYGYSEYLYTHTVKCKVLLRTPDGRNIESVILEWQAKATGPWPTVVLCLTQMYEKVDEMVKEKLSNERGAWGGVRFKVVEGRMMDLGAPRTERADEIVPPPPRYDYIG